MVRRVKVTVCLTFFLAQISFLLCAQALTKTDIDHLSEQSFQTSIKLDSLAHKILESSKKIGYKGGELKAKIIAGHYFWSVLQLDTARLLLNDCLVYFNENKDKSNSLDHGKTLYTLGLVSLRSNELQQAKRYANSALQIFEKLDNRKQISNTLNLLGNIHYNLASYPKSLDYFTKAYSIKISNKEPLENCVPEMINISNVYSNMGLVDEAFKYAKLAHSNASKIQDITTIMSSLNQLGNIQSVLKDYDSACFYYNNLNILAVAKDNASMMYLVDHNIASIYTKQGDYKSSAIHLKEIMGKVEQQKLLPGLYEGSMVLLAEDYLNMKQYDSSILTAGSIYHKLLNYDNKELAINTTGILWKSYKQKKSYDSAFKYLSKHLELKDSVYSIENQRKLSSLYAEFSHIEKQNEIQMLGQEKELQKIEFRNMLISITSGSMVIVLLTVSAVLAYRNREKKQRLLNIELQDELSRKKNDLHQQALKIIYINNGLADIETCLKKMKLEAPDGRVQDIQQLLNTIHVNKTLEKEWENFNEYFGNVHRQFFSTINTQFPDLSTSEKRLASLIKMNLTNREIASILNIESTSVKMAKYRLKKKLNLSDDIDIQLFLQSLN